MRELKVLLGFYNDGRTNGTASRAASSSALRRLLVSPEFLFRIEADPDERRAGLGVSGRRLRARVTPVVLPVEQHSRRCAARRCREGHAEEPSRTGAAGAAHARRSALGGARRRTSPASGCYLRTIEGSLPNVYLFPNFGENLRQDFRRETELFFESIVRENRSVLELLTADYTFVNERLARHYGIPNVYGSQFRRVTIADENRRGLLGQGSILTVTSLADRTTVVGRGKWILENLLGAPPPPPPPDVPPLVESKSGGKVLTLRERMEQHRANPVCASCHARMDPLGFALENFDATGQWRTTGAATHRSTRPPRCPTARSFEGPAGLRNDAARPVRPVRRRRSTEKLLTYALGRGLEHYDAPAVRKIVQSTAAATTTASSR